MFHFPRFASRNAGSSRFHAKGFPHSDIAGSQITTHLPGAYRSSATSFIASFSLGIHRTPLISYQEINEPSFSQYVILCLLDDHMIHGSFA
jgi:hypothetical protein